MKLYKILYFHKAYNQFFTCLWGLENKEKYLFSLNTILKAEKEGKCDVITNEITEQREDIEDYYKSKGLDVPKEDVKVDKRLKAKYLKQINTIYKEGIIEDLKNGRDLDAIIFGYGATFKEEYNAFKSAILESEVKEAIK